MNNPLLKLSQRIDYTFSDTSLIELALTHRSCGGKNNERLEFLGDSIVNLVIAEALFLKFPEAKEGKLSRLRARMVKGVTLAELARDFGLGDFLHLGSGEMKSGGHRRESILADTVEAIIGAIYLDSDMSIVKTIILQWYDSRLNNLSIDDPLKDPKTRLQEYLQAKQLPLPKYDVLNIEGSAHEQLFKVSCKVTDLKNSIVGQGGSRRIAEQEAAAQALKLLGISLELAEE
ncbi:MAG: ribonuclease III [Oleispira sp.]|nr:ribonuclease III [Oleispira sp.]